MGLFDGFRNFLNRRKQKKLDKSQEEKKQTFIQKVLTEINSVMANEELSQESKNEKIFKILSSNCYDAKSLAIIGQDKGVDELAKALGNRKECQEAILQAKKNEAEINMIYGIKQFSIGNTRELLAMSEDYIKNFESDNNSWNEISTKQKFDLLKRIVEKHIEDNEEKSKCMRDIAHKAEHYYIGKICSEKNPQTLMTLYNEYIRDFADNNPEIENKFKNYFQTYYADILRKIEALKEIGTDITYDSIDSVPVLYEELDEEKNIERNEEIAKQLENKEIKAENLLFIRKTHVFPKDGIVETIGDYSGMEASSSPFEDILRKRDEVDNVEDFEILVPRYRATSHWCINGIVGNHAGNSFSGDIIIIEDASEHKDDSNLLNVKPEDSFFLGDVKLSPKSKIMMSVQKYKEMLQDKKMKGQLKKASVILYKDDPSKALKNYMNENGYVWAEISGDKFALGNSSNEVNQTKYLQKVSYDLAASRVKEFEKCASTTDKGLMIGSVKNPETRRKMVETVIENYEKMGFESHKDVGDDFPFKDTSEMLDNFLTFNTNMEYFKFLESKFPDMKEKIQEVAELYKKGVHSSMSMQAQATIDFEDAAKPLIDEIGTENLLGATKEFNQIQREKEKEARSKKDKELLESGMITQDEYDDRNDVGQEYL